MVLAPLPTLLVACGEGGSADKDAATHGPSTSGTSTSDTVLTSQGVCSGSGTFASPPPLNQGKGTWYAHANESGKCNLGPTEDIRVVAPNAVDFDIALCGACVEVTGPAGTELLRIVSACPECEKGHLDMHRSALEAVAGEGVGFIEELSWKLAPCKPEGAIRYHFFKNSSEAWLAVQVRNHRHPIARFEYKSDALSPESGFREATRTDWGYFEISGGLGAGPFHFRITDTEGQVLEDPAVPLAIDQEVSGQGQFAPCSS